MLIDITSEGRQYIKKIISLPFSANAPMSEYISAGDDLAILGIITEFGPQEPEEMIEDLSQYDTTTDVKQVIRRLFEAGYIEQIEE